MFAAVVGTVFAAHTTRTKRTAGRRWTRLDAFDAALVTLLLATLFVRDAEWITVLCLLAALSLTAVSSTKATSVLALLGTAAAVPLAAIRGLPWLGRTLKPSSGVQGWLPAADHGPHVCRLRPRGLQPAHRRHDSHPDRRGVGCA